MFVAPPGRFELGSYQAVHGTLRPVPAKSIDGASASWLDWMLSDWPCVTQRPFLNARTKICCEVPGLLLERGPRHVRRAGHERAADEIREAGVPGGVDADRRVVVELRAVGRQSDDRGGRR